MLVTRVHTDSGSHIEPPLDQAWDEPTKLTWHAASVTHDTGINITIHDAEQGFYNLAVGSSSISPLDYRSAWDFLIGVHTGAEQVNLLVANEHDN